MQISENHPNDNAEHKRAITLTKQLENVDYIICKTSLVLTIPVKFLRSCPEKFCTDREKSTKKANIKHCRNQLLQALVKAKKAEVCCINSFTIKCTDLNETSAFFSSCFPHFPILNRLSIVTLWCNSL